MYSMSELGYEVGRLTTTDAVMLDDVVELGLLMDTNDPVRAPLGVLCPAGAMLRRGAELDAIPLPLSPTPPLLN